MHGEIEFSSTGVVGGCQSNSVVQSGKKGEDGQEAENRWFDWWAAQGAV